MFKIYFRCFYVDLWNVCFQMIFCLLYRLMKRNIVNAMTVNVKNISEEIARDLSSLCSFIWEFGCTLPVDLPQCSAETTTKKLAFKRNIWKEQVNVVSKLKAKKIEPLVTLLWILHLLILLYTFIIALVLRFRLTERFSFTLIRKADS